MISIPSTDKKIVQNGTSDLFGNMMGSFNIDLSSNVGVFRTTRTLKTTDSSVANFGLPTAMQYFNSGNPHIYAICGARIFLNSGVANGNFTEDTTAGVPTNCTNNSDMKVFNGALYISTNSNNIYKLSSAGSYSNFAAGSTGAGTLGRMLPYSNRMYKTIRDTQIISWNTSDSVVTSSTYTLDIAGFNSGIITFIEKSSNRIWVGTVNSSGVGSVFDWDGVSVLPTREYKLKCNGALACAIYNDIPYIMCTDGVLRAFSSGDFVEVARLRLDKKYLTTATNPLSNVAFIHGNGMCVVDDEIYTNVKGIFADGTLSEYVPSGVWAYNPTNGLYHKYSFSLYNYTAGTQTDFGQYKISKVGAIENFKLSTNTDGTFIAGAEYYTDATTTAIGAFIDNSLDTVIKGAYFITPKILSTNLVDTWQKIRIKYKKFLSASDKIVLKYRTEYEDTVEATITWTSTTTFTVPNTSVVVSNYWTAGTGNEVEVIAGTGAGMCSHITNAVLAGGTWTVTVDETHTGATGTSIARFNNWNKIGDIDDQLENYCELPMGADATWIQLKVFSIFTGKDEIEEVGVENVKHQ